MTRQRALPQGLKMKVTIRDCQLSVERHRLVDTENLQMVGHFYVGPSNSNVCRAAGFGNAMPRAEQSSDRLIWDEEEPIMP